MAYRRNILYGLFVTISGLPLTSIHAQTETQDSLSVAPVPVTEERTPLHLLASGVRSAYQISKRELTKVGRKLNDIDTTYISPNQYNLAFMLEQSTWFEHYRLGSNGNDGSQSLNFAPTANTKSEFISDGAGYFWDSHSTSKNCWEKPKTRLHEKKSYSTFTVHALE